MKDISLTIALASDGDLVAFEQRVGDAITIPERMSLEELNRFYGLLCATAKAIPLMIEEIESTYRRKERGL